MDLDEIKARWEMADSHMGDHLPLDAPVKGSKVIIVPSNHQHQLPPPDSSQIDLLSQKVLDLEAGRNDVIAANLNHLRELARLNHMADALTKHRPMEQIVADLIQEVGHLTNATDIWLLEPDGNSCVRVVYAKDGQKSETMESLPLEVQDLGARVIAEMPTAPLVMPMYDPDGGGDHFIAAGMYTDQHVMGVLCYRLSQQNDPTDSNRTRFIQNLLHHTTISCENVRLLSTLSSMIVDVVIAMALAIESRDPYTGGHVERVTAYALLLGERMGMSAADLTTLRLGGLLHDIGKIAVPDAILRKPLPLTDQEIALVNPHPVVGYEIVSRIPQLAKTKPVVRWHHERFDGKGYPDGLKGEELPLLARVAAIADAFDAMTSDRPYRLGLSIQDAIAEVKKNSGTQFDPQLVDLFIQIKPDEFAQAVRDFEQWRHSRHRADSLSLLQTLEFDLPRRTTGGA